MKARVFGPWLSICLVAKSILPIVPWANAGHLINSKTPCYTHHTQMLYGNQTNQEVFYFQLQLDKITTTSKNHLHHLSRLKISFTYLIAQHVLSAKATSS